MLAEWSVRKKDEASVLKFIEHLKNKSWNAAADEIEKAFGNAAPAGDKKSPFPILEDVRDGEHPMKAIKIKVKNPVSAAVHPGGDIVDSPSAANGLILIINIYEFQDQVYNRLGSEIDVKNLKELWGQMGYKLFQDELYRPDKRRWTKQEVVDCIRRFTNECLRIKPKSIVVFIGSHGAYEKIYTSDADFAKEYLSLDDDIINQFNTSNLAEMQKTPKMFFIQACRNYQTDMIINMDNCLMFLATQPGTSAIRFETLGTWFVLCLCRIIMEDASSTPVLDVLRTVKGMMMTENQIPELKDYKFP